MAPFPTDFPARLLARDSEAWRAAFTRLWPVALHAAIHVLRQRPESEDAASAALAQLAEQTKLPDTWAGLEALTAVIARRRAISQLRSRTAAKRGDGEVISFDQLEVELPAERVAQASLDFAAMLEHLDPTRRQIVLEHFVDGRTSEEIGSRLSLKPATVRSHLFRALQELRRWLQPPTS
jgi:RNA polymerase sigma-70 factor (ECF subfamily)